jgi:hypothetical protein
MSAHIADKFVPDEINRNRLDLFAVRCGELAERVERGTISFVDAVDMAYSAAIWSGLIDDVGDDMVQHVMAVAFKNGGRP